MTKSPLLLFHRLLVAFIFFTICASNIAQGQAYISTCETVPFACPSVCQGGSVTVKIFQIQRLPVGTLVQAQLSEPSGNFGPGSIILQMEAFSTNGGSTFTPGTYRFTNDVSDLFGRFAIPATAATGSNYNLRISASNGYTSSENFRCPGSGRIAVVAGGQTLPPLPQQEAGIGKWIGHVYTWTPTTEFPLNTDALVNAQDFFNPSRYVGHTLYNSLNIDIEFDLTGGIPGSTNNGTSIGCGTTLSTKFAVRLRRKETFDPGNYTFTIQGDDGIRLSLDGGATWVLSSYRDQLYSASLRTTATASPGGICLGGPVDLVIEYYQNPAQAHLTFSATRVSPVPTQPEPQTICEGAQTATFVYGNTPSGSQYQWQVSLDSGTTFADLTEQALYSGVRSATLTVTNPPLNLNGALYRCLLTGVCGSGAASNKVALQVLPRAAITEQPQPQTVCTGQPSQFSIVANGAETYQWQVNSGTGYSNVSIPGFEGVQTATLVISNTRQEMDGWQFRCVVAGGTTCGQPVTSTDAVLKLIDSVEILQQPQDQVLCDGVPVSFTVSTLIQSAVFKWQASFNNGVTWVEVSEDQLTSGTSTPTLTLKGLPDGQQAVLFRAVVRAACGDDALSQAASLSRCCVVKELSNIITPNGDNLNQSFGKFTCSLSNFDMMIYNRWGKQVYKTADAAAGWDGKDALAGIYFYHLGYTNQGKSTFTKGYIEVVR